MIWIDVDHIFYMLRDCVILVVVVVREVLLWRHGWRKERGCLPATVSHPLSATLEDMRRDKSGGFMSLAVAQGNQGSIQEDVLYLY